MLPAISEQCHKTPGKFMQWEPFSILPQQEAIKDMLGFIHMLDGVLNRCHHLEP